MSLPPAGGNRHDRNLLDLMAIAERSRPVAAKAPARPRPNTMLWRGVSPAVDLGIEPEIRRMVQEHRRGIEHMAEAARQQLMQHQRAARELGAVARAAQVEHHKALRDAINAMQRWRSV